jgi:hypothetical protein
MLWKRNQDSVVEAERIGVTVTDLIIFDYESDEGFFELIFRELWPRWRRAYDITSGFFPCPYLFLATLCLIWLTMFHAPLFMALLMVLEVLANDTGRCFYAVRITCELCVGVVPSYMATMDVGSHQNQSSESMG